MKGNFTAGEWMIDPKRPGRIILKGNEFFTIAQASGFSSQNRDANARLIVMAPDMANVLESLVVWIEELFEEKDQPDALPAARATL